MAGHRDKVLTTTYDNGKEFAMHKLLGEILGADAFFAHPYSSGGCGFPLSGGTDPDGIRSLSHLQ